MNKKELVFIYDGKCPFCNHFAELLEFKSNLKNISFIDGRENKILIKEMLKKGFDLDKGAILIAEEKILHGAEAINYISNLLQRPSGNLLRIISLAFKSNARAGLLFPMLVRARRLALLAKGVPTSLI